MPITKDDLEFAQSLAADQQPAAASTSGGSLLARGLRNNNPGNIVKTKKPWDGEVDGGDARFKSFETPDDGLAAIGSNLLAYNDKHGLDTVDAIINRWAPASENDTAGYVQSVAKSLGVAPDQKIDVRNPGVMASLSDAIVRKENGSNPFSREQMLESARRAILGRAKAAEIKRTVPDKAEARVLSQSAVSGDAGSEITQDDVDAIANTMGVPRDKAIQMLFGSGGQPEFDSTPAAMARQVHDQQARADAPVDWGKKLSASIDSYQANLWSIPAAMGSEYALKAMQENKAAADDGFRDAGGPQSFDEMEFGKNFGQYFGHLFVQSAPYLAEFVATGLGLGAALKKGLATTAENIAAKAATEAVSKGATAAQAAKLGNAAADGFFGTIGGVIGSYPSSVGDVLSNQHEQAGKFNMPAAAALGIPYAALNAVGVEGMMMRGLSRGLPEISARVAGKGVAGAAGRAAITGAETGVIEGATETGQEVMNQLGRMSVDEKATLTSGDAPERYKESFIAGSLMGGAMGAAAGPFRKPNSPLSNAVAAAGGIHAPDPADPTAPPGAGPGTTPPTGRDTQPQSEFDSLVAAEQQDLDVRRDGMALAGQNRGRQDQIDALYETEARPFKDMPDDILVSTRGRVAKDIEKTVSKTGNMTAEQQKAMRNLDYELAQRRTERGEQGGIENSVGNAAVPAPGDSSRGADVSGSGTVGGVGSDPGNGARDLVATPSDAGGGSGLATAAAGKEALGETEYGIERGPNGDVTVVARAGRNGPMIGKMQIPASGIGDSGFKIGDIYVGAAARRHGVGSGMLAAAEKELGVPATGAERGFNEDGEAFWKAREAKRAAAAGTQQATEAAQAGQQQDATPEALGDDELGKLFDDAAAEVAAESATAESPKAPVVSIADVPPKLLKRITVPIERMVGDQVQTIDVKAGEALAEIDQEITAYETLLSCVRAAA